MIIKAIEELAQALCEVSPSGGNGGMQVLLTEEQWRALEVEMNAAMLLRPNPSFMGEVEGFGERDLRNSGPFCVRLYTPGGEVTIRRAP